MMMSKRILSLCLSTAFVATVFTGCGGNNDWAAKTTDITVPAGQYIYYVLTQTLAAERELETTPSSADSDFFKMTIDDQSAESWIKANAQKDMKDAIGAEIEFENLGLSLSEEELKEIADNTETYYESMDSYYHISDLGISEDSLEKALTDEKKYEKVFDAYYEDGGSQEVSDADITSYITNDGASYKMMTVPKEVSTELTSDSEDNPGTLTATDSSTAEAQSYVDQINGGKSFDDVYHDYEIADGTEEEDFEPLELEYVFKEDQGSVSDEVFAALFDRATIDGPAILVEGDSSFYIVQRYSPTEDIISEQHDDALNYMKEDEFSGELAQIADTENYQENNDALEQFSPRAINNRLDKFSD